MPPPAPTTTERPIPATKTRPVSNVQPTPTSQSSSFTTDVLPVSTSTTGGNNVTAVLGEQSLEAAYSFIFGLIVFCSIIFLFTLAIGFGLCMLRKQKTGIPDINAVEMKHLADCTCKSDEAANDNSSITSRTAINAANGDAGRSSRKRQDSDIQEGVRLYARQPRDINPPKPREHSRKSYYSMYLEGQHELVPPPTDRSNSRNDTQKKTKNLCSIHSDQEDQFNITKHGQNNRLDGNSSNYSQRRSRLRSG